MKKLRVTGNETWTYKPAALGTEILVTDQELAFILLAGDMHEYAQAILAHRAGPNDQTERINAAAAMLEEQGIQIPRPLGDPPTCEWCAGPLDKPGRLHGSGCNHGIPQMNPDLPVTWLTTVRVNCSECRESCDVPEGYLYTHRCPRKRQHLPAKQQP